MVPNNFEAYNYRTTVDGCAQVDDRVQVDDRGWADNRAGTIKIKELHRIWSKFYARAEVDGCVRTRKFLT